MPEYPKALGSSYIALSHMNLSPYHPIARGRSLIRSSGSGGKFQPVSNIANGGIPLVANITLGEEKTFHVAVDTGSSDTWGVGSDLVCVDMNDSEINRPDCISGVTHRNSSHFTPLPDLSMDITYGDLDHVAGGLGVEAVTVGDNTVANQTIAVVDLGLWVCRLCFVKRPG